ncbi:MAG: hypothetical protein AB1589_24735 [Cyanobacteriota bacterium]
MRSHFSGLRLIFKKCSTKHLPAERIRLEFSEGFCWQSTVCHNTDNVIPVGNNDGGNALRLGERKLVIGKHIGCKVQ